MPDWLRFALPLETPRQQESCRRHDERYARGGEPRARLVTDLVFALDLLGCPEDLLDQVMAHTAWYTAPETMEPARAEQYLWGVRMYGGSHWQGRDAPGSLPPAPPPDLEAP